MADFDSAGQDEPVDGHPGWLEARPMEGKEFIQSGLLDTLDSQQDMELVRNS